ncbi:hypothetical protein Taro_007583, partial [Colocasia esculenta]|nr:hypothetical protein [Colocasia esculenta]
SLLGTNAPSSLLGTNAPSSTSPSIICFSLDKESSSTSPGLIYSSLDKESGSASLTSSAACRLLLLYFPSSDSIFRKKSESNCFSYYVQPSWQWRRDLLKDEMSHM